MIPEIAYIMYKKKYIKPTKEEGFYEIIDYEPNYPLDIIYSNYLY